MKDYKLIIGSVLGAFLSGALFGSDLPLRPLSELETPFLDKFLEENGVARNISLTEIAQMDDRFQRAFIRTIQMDTRHSSDRRHLLEYVAFNLSDPRPGIWQRALEYMRRLPSEDFTPLSREIIQSIDPPGLRSTWLSLYAAADLPFVIEIAREYIESDVVTWMSNEWSGTLILARYGDDDAIATVIEVIQAGHEWTRDWRLNPRFFNALINIKQPEAADVAAELLFSDEVVHQSISPFEAHVSRAGAWMLSQMLQDFPVENRAEWFFHTAEEVEAIREWVRNRDGEWRIIDQRVNLRNNPEDFPWALEQQRLREARREAEERAWLEERGELAPDDEPAVEATQRVGEIDAEEHPDTGDERGGRGILTLVFVLLVAAGAGAFLLFNRQR